MMRFKKKKKKVMQRQSLTTSHQQICVRSVSKQWPPWNDCSLVLCDAKWYRVSLLPVWVTCPGCDPLQPTPQEERVRSREGLDTTRTVQQQLKHWCVHSAGSITSLKCSIVWAAVKNINSIPARPRTVSRILVELSRSCYLHLWKNLCVKLQ